MAAFRAGKVVSIESEGPGLVKVRVAIGADEVPASGYPAMVGQLNVGDRVVVNTTGLELGLGTGGEGFVLWNLDGPEIEPGEGHIVKMRYTPWQTNVLTAEAPESEHHMSLVDADDLDGTPVVACGLHSQIAAVAAGIKAERPETRVAYVMSDAGSLPIAWSNLVRELRESGVIDLTCTYGHAFGGDLEAVNVYSALVATKMVGRADAIVVAMGPGGVGTGTRLGYSGIEQAQVLDAAAALGGSAIAALRISFVDARDRHQGISHHSITSIGLVARRVTIVLPELPEERGALVRTQLKTVASQDVVIADGRPGLDLLRERGIDPSTMGRSMSESPEPFLAASAAGRIAAQRVTVVT
ncbi:MAG TPA: DUF3866 family protein [Actinomycetota bacterium]|nr:DUF3866 family protein [Actinomycetota bacterium]